MPTIWDRTDISHWLVLKVETSATSVATWLENPSDKSRWLHKSTSIPQNGVEQGEDWAEVVTTQISRRMGVPSAETLLCMRENRRGSISRDVCPEKHALYNGYLRLADCAEVTDYYPHLEGAPAVDPQRPGVRRPGHRLDNIRSALEGAHPPPGFSGPEIATAFDVFTGYLLLDAIVANRDRHEENWAVLDPGLTSLPMRLAPTYDHASSLGYNLNDSARERELARQGGIAKWAIGGTAWRFEHEKRPTTTLVDLALEGLTMCTPAARAHWTSVIQRADFSDVLSAVNTGLVSGMSDAAATFACTLIEHNLERLRNGI